MAAVDPAFLNAGQEVGIEIWRIEKLKVVRQDKSTYGQFYSGDSYIILNTKKRPGSSKLEWDLHFWLGKDTSQDEKGVCAYKTVELDDSLGGGPVQYREVQDHESKLFLSYFKNGISYMDGGVDSGFRKVERGVYEKRLLLIKGKRNVRVRQVECTYASLNKGDVFILDAGLTLFVWVGPMSSKMERIKGLEIARRIKDDERGGKAKINIIDTRWESDDAFFTALGDRGEIRDEDPVDDVTYEHKAVAETVLYRVCDESGKTEMEKVDEQPLKREHLDSKDCFILDSGPSGIYAWIGKKCSKNEKKQAWSRATDFLTMKGYADWTPVTQVVEGGETPLFKQYFKEWIESNAQVGLGQVSRQEKIASYSSTKFDSTTMYKQKQAKEENLPDDGEGKVEIWRVENNDLVAQSPNSYGTFYTGDCYVMLYTYRKSSRENYIIYFWQGSKSTTDERAGSAIFSQQMDDGELNGAAVQVRVVQGREPEHFLRIFQGRMVTFLGGVNNKEPDSPVKMYQIRGTNRYNTRAAQVVSRASSLNSNDVFIVDAGDQCFVWNGKGASPDEKKVASNLVASLIPATNHGKVMDIEEGQESSSADFWSILGGQEAYATGERLEMNAYSIPPRLFQCSNASGRFDVEEVVDFSQEDLIEDDVMILDTVDEVYVWVGVGANDVEKKMSLKTAMDYVKHDPSGRNVDNTVILQIKQGFEPPAFTGHFLGWDPEKWSSGKTFEDLKQELGEESVKSTTVQEELAVYDQKHSYQDLIKDQVPKGVDSTQKEQYLLESEFETVFKMTLAEFNAMPQWKRIQAKKKVNLF